LIRLPLAYYFDEVYSYIFSLIIIHIFQIECRNIVLIYIECIKFAIIHIANVQYTDTVVIHIIHILKYGILSASGQIFANNIYNSYI